MGGWEGPFRGFWFGVDRGDVPPSIPVRFSPCDETLSLCLFRNPPTFVFWPGAAGVMQAGDLRFFGQPGLLSIGIGSGYGR